MKIIVTTALGEDILHMTAGTTYQGLRNAISFEAITWIEDKDGFAIQIRHIISMREVKD